MFYSDCRLKYHFWGMMTHVFNAILGYIIMLAVMQYNWWIFIAVLLGNLNTMRVCLEEKQKIYPYHRYTMNIHIMFE